MWRLPFLNLTFIVLVLLIVTMQKWAPGTQLSEDDFTEFGESTPEIRGHSVRADDGYVSQISASFTRIADHFAQLWERGEILAEWPIENNAAQWEKSYASTIAEKELIEARFHVETAEVYEWSINNRQRTVAELNRAERFLRNARPLIKKPALATIERVTKELELMKIDTTGAEASRPANYETIKANLDRVIDWVRTAGL